MDPPQINRQCEMQRSDATRQRQATRNETLAACWRLETFMAQATGSTTWSNAVRLFPSSTKRRGADGRRAGLRAERRGRAPADHAVRAAVRARHPGGGFGHRRGTSTRRGNGSCAVSEQDVDDGGDRLVRPYPVRLSTPRCPSPSSPPPGPTGFVSKGLGARRRPCRSSWRCWRTAVRW